MIVESGTPPATVMESQLPPLSVDTMSQVQLSEFIPYLVCLVTGRQHPFFGKSQFKPEWWPDSVDWTSPDDDAENVQTLHMQIHDLKTVVKSCYKYLGQENLLGGAAEPDFTAKDNIPVIKHEPSLPETAESSQEGVEDPIWICFLCAQQFKNQDELMTHQDQCEKDTEEEMEEEPCPPTPPSPPVTRNLRPRHHQPSNIVIRPKPIQTCPRPIKLICRRRRAFTPEPYVPPPKEHFLKALNLSDTPKEPPRVATPVSDIDSDCEIVDVTYDETAVKIPRTPKSLMSQLSRDIENSARKRHLSFSQVLDLPEEYSSEDSESESENGSQKKPKTPFGTLLCGIDLSSPLGQRVKKHWKIETNYSILSGDKVEAFCSGPLKNDFVEKLRHRGESSYPIVFNKKNRKHMAKHKHQYKFNSSQRKEFMICLQTGLSKRSRKLLTEIVKCSVKLERLKPGVIKRWVRRKPPPPYPYAYIRRMFEQEHPIIRKIVPKPILGPKYIKLRQISDGLRRLNRPHNLLPNQRVVTKMVQNPDGTSSMKMICAQSSTAIRPQFNNNVGNNRRKQTFDQNTVRPMEPMEIEIIELSSSDEEGDTASKQHCQTVASNQHRQNVATNQHRQIGQSPKAMTHFKNITNIQPNSSQLQRMPAACSIPNKQNPTNSASPQGSNPLKIDYFPRTKFVPRPASPSNTRARIFQGMKSILSPSSSHQNRTGVSIHSSPPGGSTCKELMQNSKPVSGLVNRAMFKNSPPQILKNSANSPVKLVNRNSNTAAQFPGYANSLDSRGIVHPELVAHRNNLGGQHSNLVRQTNGSPLPQRTFSPKPTVGESKPRNPIMESEVIVIDDED